MLPGRTCAIDLGKVRVGLAIDDELGSMAHPRGVLDPRDRASFFASLRDFARKEGVTRFVVGLPVEMSGNEGTAAREARKTARAIADQTGVEVELWDERLTTVVAHRALRTSQLRGAKVRQRIDEAAAVAILQSWLDGRRHARGI